MSAGYANFVCIVLHDQTRLRHDVFRGMYRPNPEVPFYASGHEVTRVRTERHTGDVLVVSAEFSEKRQILSLST